MQEIAPFGLGGGHRQREIRLAEAGVGDKHSAAGGAEHLAEQEVGIGRNPSCAAMSTTHA